MRAQVAWMLGATVFLALLDALTLPLFLAAALVGLFLAAEVTAPVNVDPAWRARLRWLLVLGVLVFGGFVANHLRTIIPWEVL